MPDGDADWLGVAAALREPVWLDDCVRDGVDVPLRVTDPLGVALELGVPVPL